METAMVLLLGRADTDSDGFDDESDGTDDTPKEKPGYFWVIGLLIYLTGTIMMSGGVNLQKYALNRNKELAEESGEEEIKGVRLLQNPLWVVGVVCYIFAGLFLSVALFFATPALLTPFMSMVLISNIVFAHFLLHEVITRKDLLAIAIVVVGLILTTIFAPHDTGYYTPEYLKELFLKTGFIVFFCLLLASIAAFLAINYVLYYQVKACEIPAQELSQWKLQLFPFSFAALAGIFGGGTVLLMKSSIEIIVNTAADGILVLLSSWSVYLLVFIMGVFWSMQMFWLNRGLRFFHAVYIVSLEAVINEIVAVVGSLVYFGSTEDSFPLLSKIFFSLGLVIGVTGVLVLAYWRKEMDEDAPNVFDMNPDDWLALEEDNVEDEDSSEETTSGISSDGAPAVVVDGGDSTAKTPLIGGAKTPRKSRKSARKSVRRTSAEVRQDRDNLILNPQPFTPTPLLAYSPWGVPETTNARLRRRSHQVHQILAASPPEVGLTDSRSSAQSTPAFSS
eukprot:CAMPEP_0119135834 /NCGR_PEP_ID=MMETSP1310-20130426/20155_1 /TAXON_ID=464262 /ORGANISM="Genus nov. species nov., Strain RCC2339" /LENGTH=505 /DNA_ID=CAMNT_0007126779 /DNA_START=71 /DNA_END=1585 /DNA_ORIENTATION=-